MRKYNPANKDTRIYFEHSLISYLLLFPCDDILLFEKEDFMDFHSRLIFERLLDKYQKSEEITNIEFYEYFTFPNSFHYNTEAAIICMSISQREINSKTYPAYVKELLKAIEKDKIYTLVMEGVESFDKGNDKEVIIKQLTEGITSLTFDDQNKKERGGLEIFKTFFDLENKISDTNIAYSGMPALNHSLRHLNGGRLIVIAGRPGQGKSALAIQIMVNAFFKDKKVGYLSLEMGENEVAARMMANRYEFNVSELQCRDKDIIMELMDKYSKKPFPPGHFFFSEGPYKLSSILRKIKEWKEKGISFVIIDHIGLINAEINFNATRNDQLGKISGHLKQLAIELKMPIIALSQLNRASENEKRRPHLSDLRDSGNIEQDADAVIMFYEETKTNDGIKIFDLGLLKNRAGLTGWLGPRFAFNGSIQQFSEIMLNVQLK